MIKDLYQDRSWSLNKISFDIPHILANKINYIIIPASNLSDRVLFGGGKNPSGFFSTNSCYNLINESHTQPEHNIKNFDWIWSLHCPKKIFFFLSLCYHDRIPCRKHLHHIGINIDPTCTYCRNGEEDIQHIFLHYNVDKSY